MEPMSCPTTTERRRLVGLDRLRGLAVVTMVIDHLALLAGGADLVRLTVGRVALPAFCLVAGALVRPLDGRRAWRLGTVFGAGVVATALGAPLGIGQPDVLLVLAVVLAGAGGLLAWAWRRCSSTPLVVAGALAVLQPVTWPIPWTGYQPGTVLALVLIGRQLGRGPLERWGRALPAPLGGLGRYPLTAYVGHLAVLAVLVRG